MRVEALAEGRRALRFRCASIRRGIGHLALQIVDGHAVVVDNADGAHPGRRQIHEERRSEPAGAHHEHARRLEPLLALPANLFQKQMPLVAGDFIG